MVSDIQAFIKTLEFWEQNSIDGDTRHFPVLSEKISQSPLEPHDSKYHVEIVSNLKGNFTHRSKDFNEIAIVAQFIVSRFMLHIIEGLWSFQELDQFFIVNRNTSLMEQEHLVFVFSSGGATIVPQFFIIIYHSGYKSPACHIYRQKIRKVPDTPAQTLVKNY
ncbi:unnamed protein product [Acanthoscelides obtectus]|uniref:Uncharacterized protein n=1 Tax=Acanthoscelides obtectus TaxID=200917 RepID=A0A9P0VNZ5_ACAOB|nr:unnamed protein product [Acanthoscelides obtectus]CAK1648821.1 hypothetical protein AOBTE_LOCUS15902 [Acanthoscelides obtectus]